MKIAGLDIGSTGCKLTVFDSDGSCLGRAYRDYPVKRTKTAHEVEAQDIIDSVFEVMEEVGRRHPDIAGIGVTSFGETFALTDGTGNPLHTAMLYTDPSYSGRQFEVYCYLDGKLESSFGFVIGEEYEDQYVQYYTYPYTLISSGYEYISTTVIFKAMPQQGDGDYISFDRLELRDPSSGEVYIPDMAEAWRESYIKLFAKDPVVEHNSAGSESAGSVG